MFRQPFRLMAVVAIIATAWLVGAGAFRAGASTQNWTLSPEDEVQYIANINAVRASNGLGPLTLNVNMRDAARSWTYWMAENTTLAHSDDIVTGAPSDWLKVGENVGRGNALDAIWDAFLASPSHAANVLDPDFDFVGVGVVWTDEGRQYTTHRFASTESAGNPQVETDDQPSEPQSEATVDPPSQTGSPPQLPFAAPGAEPPPADPERLLVTMAVLLEAG